MIIVANIIFIFFIYLIQYQIHIWNIFYFSLLLQSWLTVFRQDVNSIENLLLLGNGNHCKSDAKKKWLCNNQSGITISLGKKVADRESFSYCIGV